MKLRRVLLFACLMGTAFAQMPGIPKFPGMGRHKDNARANRDREQRNGGTQVTAAGVPVPADSPVFDAFRKLQEQKVYHQRMAMSTDDPQMAQIMSQMGFAPIETIVAGDTKQVSMHFKMPVSGQVEDF